MVIEVRAQARCGAVMGLRGFWRQGIEAPQYAKL